MKNKIVNQKTPDNPKTQATALFTLSLVLWLLALIFAGYAVWFALTVPGGTLWAALILLISSLTFAAGFGLYRMKRWGVILFGILVLLGSVNHLVTVVQPFTNLTSTDLLTVVESIISVLSGFLIPFALIYLTILLWRKTT